MRQYNLSRIPDMEPHNRDHFLNTLLVNEPEEIEESEPWTAKFRDFLKGQQ